MLKHRRRSTLTFLGGQGTQSKTTTRWEDRENFVTFRNQRTPTQSSNSKANVTLDTDENAVPISNSRRSTPRRSLKKANRPKRDSSIPTNYRQRRRLVKRNTIGAPSAPSQTFAELNRTPKAVKERILSDTPWNSLQTGASTSSNQRKETPSRRRSSGAFLVDVSKRKVVQASSAIDASSQKAFRNETSFSELERRTLLSTKQMLQLRYSGGDIPQDHPLFSFDKIDPGGWDTALQQLNAIMRTDDNLKQVILFQNCIRSINKRCTELNNGPTGADSLLPALIYTVLNSKIPDLIGLYRTLRLPRASAVAKYYNQAHLETALVCFGVCSLLGPCGNFTYFFVIFLIRRK